jgi:hypothetical protein
MTIDSRALVEEGSPAYLIGPPYQSADPGIHGRDVGTTGPTFARHDTQSERRFA